MKVYSLNVASPEKVIFNRDKQTAKSKTKSMFKSKNATITSDGFNIHDKGNKIIPETTS